MLLLINRKTWHENLHNHQRSCRIPWDKLLDDERLAQARERTRLRKNRPKDNSLPCRRFRRMGKVKRYKNRMIAAGMVRVEVWVPKWAAEKIKEIAAGFRSHK